MERFKLDTRAHRTWVAEVLERPVLDDDAILLSDNIVEAIVHHPCVNGVRDCIYEMVSLDARQAGVSLYAHSISLRSMMQSFSSTPEFAF